MEETKNTKKGDAEKEAQEEKNTELEELSKKAESFDIIESDYERLKNMARKKGLDVGGMLSSIEQSAADKRRAELLEHCDDEKLVDHLMSLEAAADNGSRSDFCELKALFPEIKEMSQLPPSVVKAADLRGSTLLDEYLRYNIRQKREKEAFAAAQKKAAENSVGSQRNACANDIDPSSVEFIKAVWGR